MSPRRRDRRPGPRPDGKLSTEKVGATSVAAGAGIGACLLVLGPALLGFGAATAVVGGGVGMAGGAVGGSMHHKGLKLSDEDKARIAADLTAGRRLWVSWPHAEEAAAVEAKLAELGGTATVHEVVDEAAVQAGAAEA